MEFVKKYTYENLCKKIIGKKVRFKSDCELFPNFDVTGNVLEINIKNSEYIIKIKTNSGKLLDIGSNMKNLEFDILV